ncbi:hypothetical protein ACFQUU_21840 [Herbaspirillum sp. GCM10030257]|uniref:hypothetical protein n=1 Tax=Herbaspirillum sp. GCM10030257 TaxID=3273393 RepID=UPI0036188E7B
MTFPRAPLWHLLHPSRKACAPIARESAYNLFHHWLSFAGLLLFAAYLLWQYKVWATLASADPTGITLIIIAIFVGCTLWCGCRAYLLCAEAEDLASWRHCAGIQTLNAGAVHAFLSMRLNGQATGPAGQLGQPQHQVDVLAECLHGPSESAWWINGVQIKLGLLGKVIGFSILALQIARIDSFDAAQSQTLLRSLTGGLGIALLTTAVGLVANILLGLQLVQIDRYADRLLAETLAYANSRNEARTLSHAEQ